MATKTNNKISDAVKAMRKGNREAQFELLGPGFHTFDSVHKSDKQYTRKIKHKKKIEDE